MSLNVKTNKPLTRSGSTSSASSTNNELPAQRAVPEFATIASLDDLWTRMQGMFERTYEKIESSKTELAERITDVEGQLGKVREECSSRVDKLEETLSGVRLDLDHTTEAVHRMEKNDELIISGIPFQNNENLASIFLTISQSIGYSEDSSPFVELKRLARQPIARGATPPILCQFAHRLTRNEFYRKYLGKRNLSLRNIGFENDNRIFINENLTSKARSIRTEAIKQKKLGRIQSVTTRDGVVYVKFSGSGKLDAIHNIQQLN